MFILVPDTVQKSLSDGTVPRTKIHYPSAFSPNRKTTDCHVTNIWSGGSRDDVVRRYECQCGPQHEMSLIRPCWVACGEPVYFREEHPSFQGVFSHSVLSAHGLPAGQNFVGFNRARNTPVKTEAMVPAKIKDPSEDDELESLESPRSFASSSSSSSKDDMVGQLSEAQVPSRHPPVAGSRTQLPNPWGRASYSDLITMAITSRDDNLMTLSDIYSWIVKNIPYFNDKGSYLSVQGWKNAVRHTLSLRKRFTRVPDPERPYKSMWTISSDYKRTRSPKSKNIKRKTEPRTSQSMDLDRAVF